MLGGKDPPRHRAHPVRIAIEFSNPFGVVICWYNETLWIMSSVFLDQLFICSINTIPKYLIN